MNNETQQTEQETKSEGGFLQTKLIPMLKGVWADKLKCLYILALFLQVFFLLLQIIPIMDIATEVKKSLFSDYKLTTERLSMLGFCKKEGVMMFLFLFNLVFFSISMKCTLTYFIRKRDKMKSGFLMAKLAVIFFLAFFGIIMLAALEIENQVLAEIKNYTQVEASDLFSLTFAGNLYWLVAVALLIVLFVLSVKVKERKEEEKVAARVEEELKKKNEQEIEK